MHRFRVGILAAIFSAAAAVPVAAQDWYVGAEAGLNISDFDLSVDTETDTETGLRIGGVLRYDFAPDGLIGIQTGVAYSQKGTSLTEDGTEVVFDLDYIEVPLLLTVNVPTGSSVRPRIYAGPQVAFEASCSIGGNEGGASLEFDCDSQELADLLGFTFDTKNTDFSILFGGGLEVEAGPGVLTFDGRYDLGLTDINDVPDTEGEIKNRNIQLMAGYAFRLQ